MSRPRLPVSEGDIAPGRSELALQGKELRYLGRVLRLGMGDEVVLFDAVGREADARVVRAGPRELVLALGERRYVVPQVRTSISLMVSLLKHEKMDWVVQKATELGAREIVPVASDNAVVRLDGERAAARVARWRKIALEATRQSGRAVAPQVAEVRPFAAALSADSEVRLLFWEQQRAAPLAEALRGAPPPRVAALIGPEGGFSDGEVSAAVEAGWSAVGLGPYVLRAETAALAALTVLQWHYGALTL